MSSSAPGNPAADPNLLFGVLALQMDFVCRDALVSGMNAWLLCKHRPLGDLLVEQGSLTREHRQLLDQMVAAHLRAHGSDVRRSLAAAGQRSTIGDFSRSLADPGLQATLAAIERSGSPTIDVRSRAATGMRYEVLRPHARGGLGLLSVARDAELGREVALKEMLADVADDAVSRERFVREAEVTGGLEHPGIVPVYGLGRHADGRPYYAMRLIRGESLEQAIKRLHAGEAGYALRGLLTRFVAACNALAYAHSRGVIHRDVKPANVMLGPYGETLVVDWGLAKVVGSSASDKPLPAGSPLPIRDGDSQATRAGSLLGTPPYMSPEQARGQVDSLGPATDVYSLGATLYSILTGRSPVQGSDAVTTLEKVSRGDWTAPRQLSQSVPAALDAVCCKAMALQPEDRYASPLELAADVERWLADEPVTAWHEPWPVRTGRWVRRHRTLVSTAVVVLLLGGAGLVWQQRIQARQRAERDQRRAIAEAALQRSNDALVRGRWAEARAALQQAEDRLPDATGENSRRIAALRRDLDLVQRLDDIRMDRSVRVQGGHFETETADRDYEATFRGAGLGSPEDNAAFTAARVSDSAVRDTLVAALDDWADVATGERRARILEVARRADPDPTRDRLRDSAAWQDPQTLAKLAREAPADAITPGLAATIGGKLANSGEGEEMLRAAQARVPGDFWLNYSLGQVLVQSHRPAQAEAFMRAAIAARPKNSAAHNGLAVALERQGRLHEATAVIRHALELDPTAAPAQTNLGWLLARQGKFAEAEPVLRRAAELDPKSAKIYADIGWTLTGLNRLDEAEDALRKALALDPKEAVAHDFLGRLLEARGNWTDAAASYRKAIESDPKNPWAPANLGWLLDRQGKLQEAEALYRKSLALDPNNTVGLTNLGWLVDRQGKLEEAADLYRKATQADATNPWALNNLGWLLERQDKVDQAVPFYQKAVAASPSIATVQANLARSLLKTGHFADARETAKRAVDLFSPNDPDRLSAMGFLRRAMSAERSPGSQIDAKRFVSPTENLERAERARTGRQFADAACLAAEAFSDDTGGLAEKYRYKAACAAVLAGCGQGENPPPQTERHGWRRPALVWLRAELAALRQRSSKDVKEKQHTSEELQHWLVDPDLSGVRDEPRLVQLPEDERNEWQAFWANVKELSTGSKVK
jgi:serine/threonine protein kinase/tetratricopeptide (TPR) repeat protein